MVRVKAYAKTKIEDFENKLRISIKMSTKIKAVK